MDIGTNTFTELFERKNLGQLALLILFLIYLIMGYKMPYALAFMIDTIWGKITVIIIAFILFAACNPLLGIIGFFVAYKLLTSSTIESNQHYSFSPVLDEQHDAASIHYNGVI